MQLKGLVRVFAILLIVICLYQLSFTLFVRNHEKAMADKAESWVKRNYPSASKTEQEALTERQLIHILDSTKNTKIGPFGFTTYKDAKDKELALGLDLQGGMSVTMEVGLDGLIKSLAEYTKDNNFKKALDAAVAKKANSDADLVSLFIAEYQGLNAGGNLANFFINKSCLLYTSPSPRD